MVHIVQKNSLHYQNRVPVPDTVELKELDLRDCSSDTFLDRGMAAAEASSR